MKILHTVEKYYPPEGGMQKVVREISERLVKKGHSVSIATRYDPLIKHYSMNSVRIEQFKISGNLVRGYEGETKEIKRYQDFLKNSDFDIIANFAAQQWATDLTLPLLKKLGAKKVLVPTGFSGLHYPQYRKYFAKMKNWMKQYDMNVFLSNDYRDINFARENGVIKRVLIPNGASEEEFLLNDYINVRKKLEVPENDFLILHVGSHTGLKGHDEAMTIFSQAKITNATLLIIGDKTAAGCSNSCLLRSKLFKLSPRRLLDKKKVILASLSRKGTISSYRQADLFLFPSIIECSPLVLFESMASKTPFLATDVGNAKEIIKWSNSGILLPTKIDEHGYSHAKIKKSAKVLADIYNQSKRRKEMAEDGFKAWKKRFTWNKITEQYENMYKDLLSQ